MNTKLDTLTSCPAQDEDAFSNHLELSMFKQLTGIASKVLLLISLTLAGGGCATGNIRGGFYAGMNPEKIEKSAADPEAADDLKGMIDGIMAYHFDRTLKDSERESLIGNLESENNKIEIAGEESLTANSALEEVGTIKEQYEKLLEILEWKIERLKENLQNPPSSRSSVEEDVEESRAVLGDVKDSISEILSIFPMANHYFSADILLLLAEQEIPMHLKESSWGGKPLRSTVNAPFSAMKKEQKEGFVLYFMTMFKRELDFINDPKTSDTPEDAQNHYASVTELLKLMPHTPIYYSIMEGLQTIFRTPGKAHEYLESLSPQNSPEVLSPKVLEKVKENYEAIVKISEEYERISEEFFANNPNNRNQHDFDDILLKAMEAQIIHKRLTALLFNGRSDDFGYGTDAPYPVSEAINDINEANEMVGKYDLHRRADFEYEGEMDRIKPTVESVLEHWPSLKRRIKRLYSHHNSGEKRGYTTDERCDLEKYEAELIGTTFIALFKAMEKGDLFPHRDETNGKWIVPKSVPIGERDSIIEVAQGLMAYIKITREIEGLKGSENVRNISDKEFESEILNSFGLYLLEITSDSCGACKSTKPHINAFATRNKDESIKVVNINNPHEKDYPIMNKWIWKFLDGKDFEIPAYFVMKDGDIIAFRTGAFSSTKEIEDFVDSAIKPEAIEEASDANQIYGF